MIDLIRPGDEVKDIIDVYYYADGDDYPTDQYFRVPTFFRPWLIFHICGSGKVLIDDHEYVPAKTCVKAPFDHPYLLGYTQHKISAMLVQFSPTALHELTGMDISGIKNTYPDAREVWSAECVDSVNQKLDRTEEVSQRVAALNGFFMKLRRSNFKLTNKSTVVRKAINFVEKEHYNLHIDELCEALSISSKTLERAFKTVTGISPKKYFSGSLFEELTSELMINKHKRISEIVNSPFYDLSHVNKWFKRYTHLSPTKFNKQDYHTLENIIKYQNQFGKTK